MASVHKRGESKYWYGVVRRKGLPPKFFSTEIEDTGPESKKEALALVVAAERVMRQHEGKPSGLRAALSRLADDFLAPVQEDPGPWLVRWASARRGEVAAKTSLSYELTMREASAWLAAQNVTSFTALTKSRITDLRDHWAASASPVSANHKVKHLRIALGDAVAERLLPGNPAADVGRLREEKTVRRKFEQDELTKLFKILTGEWRTITLLGLYTGQRLNDLASLQWRQVDLKEKTITFTTAKTEALVALPLMPEPLAALKAMPKGKPNEPILPGISKMLPAARSNRFRSLLAKVGLAQSLKKKIEKKGEGKGKATSELSFHSLRHTTTSMLKSAGVSNAVAQAIVGHESAAVSRTYTHLDIATMREAMEKLPNVG